MNEDSQSTPRTVSLGEALDTALAMMQRGEIAAATTLSEGLLGLAPHSPGVHFLASLLAQRNDRLDQALTHMERALALAPQHADFHERMGMLRFQAGQVEAAEGHFRQVLALQPDSAEAHNNLANLLRHCGRHEEALAGWQRALELRADFPAALCNLGVAHLDGGRFGEAAACWERALALDPGLAEAHNNLGNVRKAQGRMSEAAAHYRRAVELRADYAEAHSNLGVALMEQGQASAALAAFRAALRADPRHPSANDNLLLCLHYPADIAGEEIWQAHRAWGEAHAVASQPHANSADPARRLRIGYVSADLRVHSVAWFIEPVLAHHDRENFTSYCYYTHPRRDAQSARLQALADHWRDCAGLDAGALAGQIRRDGIDILVDLSGHTAGNRLAVFAGKPAPVQVTWLGYPDTSGLAAIDYRLSDALADPPGIADARHSEKLWRLPVPFLCYRPPAAAPPVAPLPCLHNGVVTFGSCNSLAKIPPMLETWAELLHRTGNTRLLVKAGNLHGSAELRAALHARFADLGIDPQRIVVAERRTSTAQHLAWYGEIDIALDSYPYNGTTTTCEALWMGVPVVSLSGDRHAARVGRSLLSALGLGELVADSTAEYLALAEALAGDPVRLAALRAGLRERMRASPLLDEQGFTANLQAAYRHFWREWCARRGAD